MYTGDTLEGGATEDGAKTADEGDGLCSHTGVADPAVPTKNLGDGEVSLPPPPGSSGGDTFTYGESDSHAVQQGQTGFQKSTRIWKQ